MVSQSLHFPIQDILIQIAVNHEFSPIGSIYDIRMLSLYFLHVGEYLPLYDINRIIIKSYIFSVSFIQKITMNDAKVKFGSLSLNNQYQVHFAGFNENVTRHLRFEKRINNAQDFISRAGLLCSDASLPASAFATAEVKDNFIGCHRICTLSFVY